MASLVLSGDTSGSITVAAPAVAGSNTQTLAAVTGTLAPIVSGTAVTASGTSVDFTGIPSWAKRITVMFSGVSTNGSAVPLIQLGDSGGIENTGYASGSGRPTAVLTSTAGFLAAYDASPTWLLSGIVHIALINTNSWVANGTSYSENGPFVHYVAGRKTLSDTLTQVRVTTTNGTDTFDAGTINIMWE